MGVMTVPYDTLARAKRFAKYMQKPWIAKVRFDKVDSTYTWQFSPTGLIASDDLFDEFDKKARKRKDFDIRPYIKKIVRDWFTVQIDPDRVNLSPEAINIVRQAVGLKPQNVRSVKKKSAPIDLLKSHGYKVRGYRVIEIKKTSLSFQRLYKVEKFNSAKENYYVYEVSFASDKKLNDIKKVLKESFNVVGVRKISPYRVKDRIIIINL